MIDESRERLTNQIAVYAADLNSKTFFSEKGLKDRKQKIKFKCLQLPKSELKEEPEEDSKLQSDIPMGTGFFEGVSNYERCLKMMLLHNTRVNKIISSAHQLHTDRLNGITRIPSTKTSKPAKKGKKTKKKKGPQVDVTIKFKAEDGHVEEIVVKDSKKKKKAKSKPEDKENLASDSANDQNVQMNSSGDAEQKPDSESSADQTPTPEVEMPAPSEEKSLQALSELNS